MQVLAVVELLLLLKGVLPSSAPKTSPETLLWHPVIRRCTLVYRLCILAWVAAVGGHTSVAHSNVGLTRVFSASCRSPALIFRLEKNLVRWLTLLVALSSRVWA